MEPTNHPFRKENDLPNLHDYVPCESSGVYFDVKFYLNYLLPEEKSGEPPRHQKKTFYLLQEFLIFLAQNNGASKWMIQMNDDP